MGINLSKCDKALDMNDCINCKFCIELCDDYPDQYDRTDMHITRCITPKCSTPKCTSFFKQKNKRSSRKKVTFYHEL